MASPRDTTNGSADDAAAAGAGASAGAGAGSSSTASAGTQRMRKYWDDFADVYTRVAVDWSTPMGACLVSQVKPKSCSRVLELGCGPGNVTALLHAELAPEASLTAYDLSPRMLELAALRLEGATAARRIELRAGDAQLVEGCEPGSFDAIVSNLCIFMADDGDACLRRMRELLAPGGRAAFSVWGRPALSLMFTLLPQVAKRLGIDAFPGTPKPARTSFHMGEAGAGELRKRVLAAGFDVAVAWHHMAAMPFLTGEEAAVFVCDVIKRNADALQALRDAGNAADADRLRAGVVEAAQAHIDAGNPIGCDCVLVVAGLSASDSE